jgi:hypothetical protein
MQQITRLERNLDTVSSVNVESGLNKRFDLPNATLAAQQTRPTTFTRGAARAGAFDVNVDDGALAMTAFDQ